MGKVLASGGGGGGTGSDECTASKAQVLAGYTAVTSDSEDEAAAGTMPDNGDQSGTLNCGQSKVIPAGYTSGGTVTANSLASQTDADATAAYIYKGKTAWVKGSKLTGTMTASSVLSFSAAAYSTSQVLCTWKNPAKGPYSGVIICAKTGGYPTSINDNRKYTGVGSNSAANGTSSAIISGLTAGTTYYFRIWAYVTCSAGDFYSSYLQATATPTAHGRKAFTSSGTFTVPAGVRSINIHCTGAGSKGGNGDSSEYESGGGGGGGYCAWKNNIAVTPGNQIVVVVGAGGTTNYTGSSSTQTYAPSSSATMNGTTLVSAKGGGNGYYSIGTSGKDGGNKGGLGAYFGGNLKYWYGPNAGRGNSANTLEFGTGTRYSGGGGGGGGSRYNSSSETTTYHAGGAGGAGGGGTGAGRPKGSGNVAATAGSAGTGGGGGGDRYNGSGSANGGSGNVIITW